MADWNLPWTGHCRCGKVKIEVSGAPMFTSACHCTGCQRMSASAFSLSVGVPSESFAVTEGEPIIGGLHGAARHYFCPHCLTWMFTRPEGADFLVNVRATMFDDTSWFTPFIETYTSEKMPWVTVPARHSYDKFPPMEEFEALLAEFAELGPASS
jgi:hypothetical protein